jgi:O-succinylbenzoic acid--CoA ligase
VFGRPDPEWGQRVVAAVVPAQGADPALAQLRPWVAERLGAPAARASCTAATPTPPLAPWTSTT